MKQCLAKIACGFAAASLALALVACDDSSSASNVNGPENEEEISSESNGGESSANVESSATVTSSATSGNSSNSNGNSATSQNGDSSNSQNGTSSASTSSNSVETCSHLTDSNCRITEGCSPTPCMNGTRVLDCATNSEYVCKSGSWQLAETCANISGVTGNDRWNCDEDDFTLLPDCKDNSITYMCVSNHWFKTEDCDPTKPNCGFDDYTICEKTMLNAYCLKTEWLDEPCDYGNDPGRFLYVYHNPDDPNDLGHTQVRYFCNASGNWEEENYGCSDPMMDCGYKIDKSDDHGILPDNAPCKKDGEQMTVDGYNYQCINGTWTRL
jgi:hypothetical protein